jgi:UDP-N-acetylglucosamine pyrophosphorylase
MDEINQKYFDALIAKRKSQKTVRLIIGENIFFTLNNVPVRHYQDLKKKEATYSKLAKESSVWLKKAQGGGGTSIKREVYLKKLGKFDHLGAKGTDLYVSLSESSEDLVSLAEIQILQSIESLVLNEFGEVFFDDLVGVESQGPIKKIWKKKSWIDKTSTYESLNKKYPNFLKFKETLQALLPTLDSHGELTLKRQAPGGHAFFAYEALLTSTEKKSLPPAKFKNLVAVIGNGEDLGSTPDGIVIGWVIDEKVPVAMITTEKTEIDLKGGQIVSQKNADGAATVTILEQAQAKESGQLALFEKNRGLFNTNVAVFNYEVLVPKLIKLKEKIGPESFERAVAPTLIQNKKSQEDDEGEIQIYEQLEGAMGSTLLNLDATYRFEFGEPLVHFVNIERQNRTRFFSPVKTAFDFFMLFHSDRFSLNLKTFRLIDHRPGVLPLISLSNSYYLEVQNVLDAFEGAEILELDHLSVDGPPVAFKGLKLQGRVSVINSTENLFDLAQKLKEKGIKELKNQSVRITPQGELIIS